jgi:hypothetical protein
MAGGVVQGVVPKFKPQYYKNKNKKTTKNKKLGRGHTDVVI